jgi:hypothetical protein
MKLLLEESFQTDISIVTEEKSGSKEKEYHIRGIYFQCNIKNGNKRIYPKENCEAGVKKYIEEQINTHRAVGELGHPETGPKINLERVSHKIIGLEWKDNDIIGDSIITNTPMGIVAKGLIDAGVQLGVSSRGAGSITLKEGIARVGKDFILSTFDIVQNPSAPKAFVEAIMEDVDWFYENNEFVARAAESVKKSLKKLSSREIAEKQYSIYRGFLDSLRNS